MRRIDHPMGFNLPKLQDRVRRQSYDPATGVTTLVNVNVNAAGIDHVQLLAREVETGIVVIDSPMTRLAGTNGDVEYAYQTAEVAQARELSAIEVLHYTNGDTEATPPFIINIYDSAATATSSGPCTDWTDSAAVAAWCGDPTGDYSVAARSASEILYGLSGRQFTGLCTSVARPARRGCTCFTVFGPQHHVAWLGSCWQHGDGIQLGCGWTDRIRLSGYPVHRVVQVTIDGDVIDPMTYRVEQYRWLTRITDQGGWPVCQDLDAADGQPGSFVVTYSHGQEPPQAGVDAANELACQLHKAVSGAACQMPSNVTQLARQGVTTQRQVMKELSTGKSGLPLVDSFLAAFNPTRMARPPGVWSPDVQQAART